MCLIYIYRIFANYKLIIITFCVQVISIILYNKVKILDYLTLSTERTLFLIVL